MIGVTINRPALILGIAIGGFFDGIILHQLLQWHHLVSGVDAWSGDLSFQITMDGLFHFAMFAALLIGLWLMRGKGQSRPDALGAALVGFGLWHVLDGVVSHWLLGIHRVRDAAEMPLLWDVGWLLIFGLFSIALGWRRAQRPMPTMRGTTSMIALVAIGMGAITAFPVVSPGGPTIVAFAPGTNFGSIVAAADAVDANLMQTDASGLVWAFDMPAEAAWWRLYLHRAVAVGRGPAAGCVSWTQI
ncbi:DUF2243 domain-containing protein [Falsirhodobacter xinxiangensis]|uniref:DUF2243 domain-containing protein n=1 Tax=Falsirhodobacter xinxiangensis TaxID=2530049 RepID=UPI0010AA36FC|nr:DUF2243 domain-containing protein [Rhodobacter xinxiangensis]